MKQILHLAPNVTQISLPLDRRMDAVQVAYRITLSPHEHEWTLDEQRNMAEYVLWAAQRISAMHELAKGDQLIHAPKDTTHAK